MIIQPIVLALHTCSPVDVMELVEVLKRFGRFTRLGEKVHDTLWSQGMARVHIIPFTDNFS